MADIVLEVGFNQDEVDKEIDKIDKKLKSYTRELKKSEQTLDKLESQYEEINTSLEIGKGLYGENSKEVKNLQLELDEVNKKLRTEYGIMDNIQAKIERTTELRNQAYFEPTKFMNEISNKANQGVEKIKETTSLLEPIKEMAKSLQKELDSINERLKTSYDIIGKIAEEIRKTIVLPMQSYLKMEEIIKSLNDINGSLKETIQKVKGVNKGVKATNTNTSLLKSTTEKASNAFSGFVKKIGTLAKRVLIFSVILSALNKIKNSISGLISRNSELSTSLNTIKLNLQSAFMPIYQTVLPALQTLMKWLAKVTSYIAAFINTILGKNIKESQRAAQALNNQAKSTKNLSSATKKANNEMNKQVAAFDELNQVSKETADNFDDISGGDPSDNGYSPGQIIDFDTSAVEDFASRFIEKLRPIGEALDRLKEKLAPFKEDFFSGLRWAYDTILKPLSDWALETLFPTVIDTIGSSLAFVGNVLKAISPSLKFFVEKVLIPIGEWTGGVIIDVLNGISWAFDYLSNVINENKDNINYCLTEIGKAIS